MKKYLFLYAVLTTALLAYGYTRYRHETRRLTHCLLYTSDAADD